MLVVESAQYWFEQARKAQDAEDMSLALCCMENAFNHTEGALCAALRKLSGKDLYGLELREACESLHKH